MIEVVFCDIDSSLLPLWKEEYIKTRKAIAEALGYSLKRVIVRESPSKRGHHVWLHLESPKPLTDMERLKLEFLFGSDVGRCWLNYLRIKRGIQHWDKRFSVIVWSSPIDEKCQKCRLRIIVEELSKDVGNEVKH